MQESQVQAGIKTVVIQVDKVPCRRTNLDLGKHRTGQAKKGKRSVTMSLIKEKARHRNEISKLN